MRLAARLTSIYSWHVFFYVPRGLPRVVDFHIFLSRVLL
jgi:hypothetical protein